VHLFKQNNKDIGQHSRRPNDASEPDPVPAFGVGVDGDGIEGSEEDGVDPDGSAPPGGSGDQHGIEVMTIPVNEIDHACGRPAGVIEMIGVGDDELFEIDHVGDKEKVDTKEDNECNIKGSLGKGQCLHRLKFEVIFIIVGK
jgi:hypothetical protein